MMDGMWCYSQAELARHDSDLPCSFTDHTLDYGEQKRALKNLLQTYLATFSDLGIETWLMHGTLLGWWWNRQVRVKSPFSHGADHAVDIC